MLADIHIFLASLAAASLVAFWARMARELRIFLAILVAANILMIPLARKAQQSPPQIPMSAAYVEPLPMAPPEMLADWRDAGLLCDHCGLPFDRAAEGNYQCCVCRD